MKNSRILLDTNIIIHREAERIVNPLIGKLFRCLDILNATKFIHPITIIEINKLKDKRKRESFNVKLDSYTTLVTSEILEQTVQNLSKKFDKTENDINDSYLLNEVYKGSIDILITEDKKIHKKAEELDISEKVYTIENFLERFNFEFPKLKEYKVLSVHKEYFGRLDLKDEFFNTLKEDYPEFEKWFRKKSNEPVYISTIDNKLCAFLYLKIEDQAEDYSDISPTFEKKIKRMKIGTFKVTASGYKLGERFLKIIFDNAIIQRVQEIYVTIFDKREEQKRLIELLEDWGFQYWGRKNSTNEIVLVRDLLKKDYSMGLKKNYPFVPLKNNKIFIVPIWPSYHTELLPDSILRTESPDDFKEDKPYRNAILKIYISRSLNRDIRKGDVILFYRTAEKGKNAYYSSVITTIGLVDNVFTNLKDENEFILKARKRSIFDDTKLKEWWNYKQNFRPFLINFLHVYSLTSEQRSRLIRKKLLDLGILKGEENELRGLKEIKKDDFLRIIREAKIDESYFVY